MFVLFQITKPTETGRNDTAAKAEEYVPASPLTRMSGRELQVALFRQYTDLGKVNLKPEQLVVVNGSLAVYKGLGRLGDNDNVYLDVERNGNYNTSGHDKDKNATGLVFDVLGRRDYMSLVTFGGFNQLVPFREKEGLEITMKDKSKISGYFVSADSPFFSSDKITIISGRESRTIKTSEISEILVKELGIKVKFQ